MASTISAEVQNSSRNRGAAMHRFISELYPICRSITGEGLRKTLRAIGEQIPLAIHEVASGTRVFDWSVPKEWNIRDAYVKNSAGQRVIDFAKSNLHVLNYSIPVRARMSLSELRPFLYSLPDHPDWIPYKTTYYRETWGFCVTERQLASLQEDTYEVCIDSSLEPGYLSYGEFLLQGRREEEILISCHSCHPSLCNDNLSSVAVATFLARELMAAGKHEYSYRFLFIPGTIGAITWLARNQERAAKVAHGMVLASVGDAGGYSYKKSRRGKAEIDRAAAQVLRHSGTNSEIMEFSPYGYDERQYCSPGFNLPVGCLSRTPWGRYAEYHSSADNLEFVHPESLEGTLATCQSIFSLLENNRTYINQNAYCEPQLGKRGLYRAMGGSMDVKSQEMAIFWLLNFSDGEHSLLDIAERSGVNFELLRKVAVMLEEHDLLRVKE